MSKPLTHGGDIFAIARRHGWYWRDVLDFSASINPLGPSCHVKPAICQALDRIVHYPEREPARLREALARVWCLDEQQILVGNGATELIYFLSRTLGSTPVTLALPVFSEFHRAFPNSQSADLIDRHSWPQRGLLVLTRPANPTGYTLSIDTLRGWLDSSEAAVTVDESFLEFSGHTSAASLIEQYPRVMILRSLTKFYALPGIRIGALIGSVHTVRLWNKMREPWQVNVLAEAAALAALDDPEHGIRSLEFVRREREWLTHQLRLMPQSRPLPSDANFLCVHLKYPAQTLCDHLIASKILIRNCTGWPGVTGEAVRVAVRERAHNERLIAAWRKFECA